MISDRRAPGKPPGSAIPGQNATSPFQQKGRWTHRDVRHIWRAPTAQDFLRQIGHRREAGDTYAITGDGERCAIIVPALTGDERMIWRFTYSTLGLRALAESGLLELTEVDEIPGFDAEPQYVGDNPQRWRLVVSHAPPVRD